MQRLEELFGDRLRKLELEDTHHKHSTLVHERDKTALDAVEAFLRSRLA